MSELVTLTVNGLVQSAPANKKLIDYLRDDLGLTSVKNACGSGVCGSCTVLVDGKAVKSCVQPVKNFANKSVLTVEGLSDREQAVYAHCFAEAGAVQCGFCIPGMVIAAKALLDINANPTRGEVKTALKNNICRCTGYVKIEDAVLSAARFFRENLQLPQADNLNTIDSEEKRIDAEEKVIGTGLYVDDLVFPDMLYGRALRSPYPRAFIKKIDTSKALAHPDCKAVFTAKDVPGSIRLGHLKKDWNGFIAEGEHTHYLGDALALVISTKKESLNTILSLIHIEAEECEPLDCPEATLKSHAPILHPEINAESNILAREHLRRGDAETELANSAFTETIHYSVPFTEHAFMEVECAIATYEDDQIMLYTGSQSVYDEQREVSEFLGIKPEQVHCHSMLVGGGFGGKEDMSVQHFAALAAYKLEQPVKVFFTRQESLLVHPKRHAMEIDMTVGCTKEGVITAVKAYIVSDTGAYASLGGPVLQRACTHAAGPYHCKHIDIEGIAVYTNNPPAGAFRGFGVTQTAFAMECTLNKLAEKVGINEWQIRYINAIRIGQTLANGQIADESTAIVECLEAVKERYEKADCAGIAASLKNSGLGVGVPDYGRCILSINDEKVHIRTSAACIGQGLATITRYMAAKTTGLPADTFVIETPDTLRTPNSGTTTASRQTVFTGEAVVQAAKQLAKELQAGKTLFDLEEREFFGEYTCQTDPIGSDKQNPVSHVAYGYAVQVVELNKEGRISRVTAAYDAGRVINRKSCEGQIEGGIVMGLGYALTEDYPLKNGVPTAKYGTLGLWRAPETPEIDILLVRSKALESGKKDNELPAYGAKGVGELATIPTAPAVQNAYTKYDGVFRTKLPMDNTAYS